MLPSCFQTEQHLGPHHDALHNPAYHINMSQSTESKKTRFLLVSDTHSYRLASEGTHSQAFRYPLPKADVLLHAGDLSWCGHIEQHRATFDVLKTADAELKIVIAGNHDLTLDKTYMLSTHGARRYAFMSRQDTSARIDYQDKESLEELHNKSRSLWTGQEAKDAAIVYLEEGTRTFNLSNGTTFTIYTSPFTPEFCGYSFAYSRTKDRFNERTDSPDWSQTHGGASKEPDANTQQHYPSEPLPRWPYVDIVMTHGPPMFHLDGVRRWRNGMEVSCPVGCINQLAALYRSRPRLSVFGHIHEGWGSERITWEKEACDASTLRTLTHLKEHELMKHLYGTDRSGWHPGNGTEKIETSLADAVKKGFAHVDVSSESIRPLRWGEESLLVNAAIVDQSGSPSQAPWIVDLDLRLA